MGKSRGKKGVGLAGAVGGGDAVVYGGMERDGVKTREMFLLASG